MLNSKYMKSISRALLPIYAATAISLAVPSNSFAQQINESADRTIDSVLYFYSYLATKSPSQYKTSTDPKFEFYTEAIRPAIMDYKKRNGKDPKKIPDYSILKELGGSSYYKAPVQIEKNIGGQTIIKSQGKKGPYDIETKITQQKIPQSQIDLENRLAKAIEYLGKEQTSYSTKQSKAKVTAQKPTRIVKRSTKLKLIQGELPQGTSIVTTLDDSDFLKTPVRTNYYSFPSAWSLITGLRLAPANNDSISDLLASALPEVRKYMTDLGVSESVMSRFEIDDKKVVNGKTLRGSDGLPLDNIYSTDNLFWSARVLAKRDYKYMTPQVEQKALEQITRADTVYLKLQEPDTVYTVPDNIQNPASLPHLKSLEQKKSKKTAYYILGAGVGILGYLLFHNKEDKQQTPTQPTGGYSQEGGNGVQ